MIETAPKISVIMPLFNSEKTVCKSIASVLSQSFLDFEIIVVNDGSTDDSLKIVNNFQDERIRVFSLKNSGASAARNFGISVSKGEYLAFIDADDYWSVDKLEDQLALFAESSDIGLVYSWSDYIDEKGNFLCSGKRFVIEPDLGRENIYKKLLVTNFLENGSTPLIRRTAMLEIGGFDEALRSAQDLDIYLKIAEKYSFRTVPKVQVFYSVTPNSITEKSTNLEKDRIDFLDQVFARSPIEFRYLKKQALSNMYRNFVLRILEGEFTPKQSLRGMRYLWLWLVNNPSCLKQDGRLAWVCMAKLSTAFMPSILSSFILVKSKRHPRNRTVKELN